ncbi:MAG TPA: hypothetical protein VEF55_12840 [Candidatus Binatia bacterium]|nr:hypothetical protein [Candidatus Binatia bacterium]
MRSPPIPQRIPPLQWRGPAFIWTPFALALAIGWPAPVFANESALQRLALVAGAVMFALALMTLGASWAIGRAPRTRRVVVLHVLCAGALTAFAAPFVLTELLALVTGGERAGNFSASMSVALTPLALVLGLPMALVSGTVFAWTALRRPRHEQVDERIFVADSDVQPFR